MYSDTVTVFNRYRSKLGDMWYPTVLRGVDLNTDRANIVAKYGEASADTAVLHIKYELIKDQKTIAGKPYLPPKEWERQTNDMLAESITFTSGQDFDFFWRGEWPDDDPISDEDYLDGFYSYMNSRHDDVYAITRHAWYSLIPHFEIGGK